MRCKHYYSFGKRMTERMEGDGRLLNEYNWDMLRMDEDESPFSLEKTIKSFNDNCKKSTVYKKAAQIICSTIKDLGWTEKKIVSFGCGKGILEWHIKPEFP